MKNTVSFDQISSIEKIIKKYFPSNEKLYCLTEDEVAWCGAAHDVNIMYMFNDKTWLDVWNNFDFFEIDKMIFLNFYSLTIPVEYYRKINNNPIISSEENENNVRFFLTGLLYMVTVLEFNDKFSPSQSYFSILDHLDPKETFETYDGYIDPMKDFFPSLVEKYTLEQLFLLSMLFMEFPKHVGISELGMKYWAWIYENTDDDIRDNIIKQFEKNS